MNGALAMTTVGAFAASVVGTLLLRRWLLERAMLDHPNARSSHATPVPRGGGAVFVALSAAWLAVGMERSGAPGAMAAAGACLMVGAIGWVDDARGVRAVVRLAVHLLAAALMVVATAGLPEVGMPSGGVPWLAWGTLLLLAVAAAWMVNLVNFMDGIDGIAGAEGIFVLAGLAAVAWMAHHPNVEVGLTLLPMAAAVGGFLVVNLSPHRVFMGDVGSGALGMLAAWALLACVVAGAAPVWSALILPAAFVADATTTLGVRVLRGEHPARPHRTHAYQRLVRRGLSHRRVTCVYALANLLVVLPAALGAAVRPEWGAPLCGGVYGALLAAALVVGSGREPTITRAPMPPDT